MVISHHSQNLELKLGGERKMAENKPRPIYLHLEHYQAYFDNPQFANLTIPQLNQIIHMHGFFKLNHGKCRRAEVVQALSEVDELLEPRRSTLNESLLPHRCIGLSVDQVSADLDALQWQETHVQSLQTLSFDANHHGRFEVGDNGGAQLEKRRVRRRGRKAKERKVFDAIHLTKPRSRKCRLKRKHLDDIGNGNFA